MKTVATFVNMRILGRNDTYDSAFEPFLGDLQAVT